MEGESAAMAVARCRNTGFQAVLPMQGKPLNCLRASAARIQANPLWSTLIRALGTGLGSDCEPARVRYGRILLLCDPDADGIHCGWLLSLFFYRWMRPLVEEGRIALVRAPLAEVEPGPGQKPTHPVSEEELEQLASAADRAGNQHFRYRRYRGLAGLDAEVLAATCLVPETRHAEAVTIRSVELGLAIFGQARWSGG